MKGIFVRRKKAICKNFASGKIISCNINEFNGLLAGRGDPLPRPDPTALQ